MPAPARSTHRVPLPPTHVHIDDARFVADLMSRARVASDLYEQRADLILEALAARLGTKLAVLGMIRLVPGAPAPEPLHARRLSSMSADELRALHEYYTDMSAVPDPALVGCLTWMAGNFSPISVLRRDLVPDDVWYASDHVINCRRPGGVDDELLAGAPAGPTGLYYATSFHKALDAPAFSERDRDMIFLLVSSIAWLFQDLSLEQEGVSLLSSLTPKMQLSLAAMLAGDSEKQAARRLGLTAHTIHQHVKRLHRHFKVTSRGELLHRCFALRLTPDTVRAAASSKGKIAFPVELDPDNAKSRTRSRSRASAKRTR